MRFNSVNFKHPTKHIDNIICVYIYIERQTDRQTEREQTKHLVRSTVNVCSLKVALNTRHSLI
jgi:hypothetical protein